MWVHTWWGRMSGAVAVLMSDCTPHLPVALRRSGNSELAHHISNEHGLLGAQPEGHAAGLHCAPARCRRGAVAGGRLAVLCCGVQPKRHGKCVGLGSGCSDRGAGAAPMWAGPGQAGLFGWPNGAGRKGSVNQAWRQLLVSR